MSRTNILQKTIKWLFYIILAWFILAVIINPIFSVIQTSLWPQGALNLRAVEKVFKSQRAMQSIRNSFLLAVCLTFSCNILGLFMVLVTDYFEIKGANLLRLIYMTTLLMGGMVMNFGYLLVYGKNGFITQLLALIFPKMNIYWFEGFGPVLFIMTLGCTHIHMLFLRNAIRSIDFHLLEAARLLGSNPMQVLRKVALPTILPVMLTLIIMTFQTGLGAFSAPVMVGGKDFQTISPLILTFANRPRSRDIAAVLSVFLGLCQILLLFLITRNERKSNFLSVSKTQAKLHKQKINLPWLNALIHTLAYALAALFLLPFAAIIVASFTQGAALRQSTLSLNHLTLANYYKVFSRLDHLQPIITSICYSAIAAVGAVLLITLVGRILQKSKHDWKANILEYSFYIPWLVPSLMLALGYLMAYDQPSRLLLGRSVIGSWWILPLAYLVISLPNSLRYIKAAYFGLSPQLEEASQLLGASKIRTFIKVLLPILLPTILALIAIQFNQLIDDYDLSVFLYQPSNPTLGIEIRQNANPDTNIDAQAINAVYSVVLMGIKGAALYFIYGSSDRKNKIN